MNPPTQAALKASNAVLDIWHHEANATNRWHVGQLIDAITDLPALTTVALLAQRLVDDRNEPEAVFQDSLELLATALGRRSGASQAQNRVKPPSGQETPCKQPPGPSGDDWAERQEWIRNHNNSTGEQNDTSI